MNDTIACNFDDKIFEADKRLIQEIRQKENLLNFSNNEIVHISLMKYVEDLSATEKKILDLYKEHGGVENAEERSQK